MQNISLNIDIIIDEYSNYVFKVVDNIIGKSLSYQDKEEIISDTFYLFWKNSEYVQKDIKSYLAAIARNCAYSKLRSCKMNYSLDEAFDVTFTEDIDRLLIVKEKLKTLDVEEYKLFSYFYLEGLKTKEIAKIFNKSVSNIKVKLHRLRKKLKEEM